MTVQTPAYVIDKSDLVARASKAKEFCDRSGVILYYSVKALPLARVCLELSPFVDGFSISSHAELEMTQGRPLVYTRPYLENQTWKALPKGALLSINSWGMLEKYQSLAPGRLLLRVNPHLPFEGDRRFNPMASQLGISCDQDKEPSAARDWFSSPSWV